MPREMIPYAILAASIAAHVFVIFRSATAAAIEATEKDTPAADNVDWPSIASATLLLIMTAAVMYWTGKVEVLIVGGLVLTFADAGIRSSKK